MKLIDQTPLQNDKGEIGILERIQGTLKYGLNWYAEMEAQRVVISRLDRSLGKGFTVLRNQPLGESGIIVPLVIIGPPGIFLAYVTSLRGTYQAKGDSWGTLSGESFRPAAINLLTRTERLARVLQTFIERQGVQLNTKVEPVLLAANPGMHVESVRPLVRVVMSDALERWAASLSQPARPVFTNEQVFDLVDHITNPRPPKPKEISQDIGSAETPTAPPEEPVAGEEPELSRAQTIFKASEEAEPLDVSELEFAFEEDQTGNLEIPPELIETNPAQELLKTARRRFLGMTIPQLALLAGMLLVELCVLIGFAYFIFFNP